MNKKVLIGAMTAGMLLALPVAAQAYDVSELQVNIWDNNQLAGLQQIADEWTEESGVKVTINVVDWDNYWTLLEAGASGGQMPDVFWMHSNTAQMYMENDLLLPSLSFTTRRSSTNTALTIRPTTGPGMIFWQRLPRSRKPARTTAFTVML